MQEASTLGLYYDSWDENFKKPFGAVLKDTEVSFTISCDFVSEKKISRIDMEIVHEGNKRFIEMNKDERSFHLDYSFSEAGLYFYRFAAYFENQRRYLSSDYLNSGGVALAYEGDGAPYYQLTVHYPIQPVPDFYGNGVVYQIFVDRFKNGNEKGLPLCVKDNSYLYANWDDTPNYVKDSNGAITRWDFYGGNILGVTEKLDYLQELGVTCIYLNPIFEARSCHKYDTGDYKKLDPMFGDEKIFTEFISEAAKRGIYVLLDGVFSHTGADSIYFNKFGNYPELGAYQSMDSPYYPWYNFQQFPDEYESWWGVGDLPNVNELEPSFTDYIVGKGGVIEKWMNLGIRGFRLDVADELPEEFIHKLREKLKKMNKESVLLGEVWEDASNKIAYGKRREYILGKSLDSVTSYPFRNYILGFLKDELSSKDLFNLFMIMVDNYPEEYFKSSLKMIGSHDVPRIATLLDSTAKTMMAATLQLLYLGPVLVYYGDEVGLTGEADPYNRATYPWDENYHLGSEVTYPEGNPRKNQEIYQHYRKLLKLRKNEPLLQYGKVGHLNLHPDVFAYKRYQGEDEIFVLANRLKTPLNLVVYVTGKVYEEQLQGIFLEATAKKLEIKIDGESSMILKKIK